MTQDEEWHRRGPVLSPVDYQAWSKGYMPPNEHVLIDALHYRGAKVKMSFSVGEKEQVWIVFQGEDLGPRQRKLMLEIMNRWFSAAEEDEADAKSETPSIPEQSP